MTLQVSLLDGLQSYAYLVGHGFAPVGALYFGSDCTVDSGISAGPGNLCNCFGAIANPSSYGGSFVRSTTGLATVASASSRQGAQFRNLSDALVEQGNIAALYPPISVPDTDGYEWGGIGGDGVARIVQQLAVGGVGVSCAGGLITLPVSVGNFNVDIGQDWDVVILYSANDGTLAESPVNGEFSEFIGWFCKDGTQGVCGSYCNDNASPSVSQRIQRTDLCGWSIQGAATTKFQLSYVGAISNGFTLNLAATTGTATKIGYWAVKGVKATARSFNCATVTGTQTLTGLAFQPRFHLFQSWCAAAGTGITADALHQIGAAISPTSRFTRIFDSRDNRNPTVCGQCLDRDTCIRLRTFGIGSHIRRDEADFIANTADGCSLNWTLASGVAKQVLWLALGDKPSVVLGGPKLGKVKIA